MKIDLNADVGEGCDDAALLPFVTSVNVACGLHAGSPAIIDRTVRMALDRGLRVGAHPGWADRDSFGRRELSLPAEEISSLVLYQVAALDGFARGRLTHVKPHGALYHQAARDAAVARAIAEGVRRHRADLPLVGQGELLRAGLPALAEAFADRRYLADGSLMPRSRPGALLTDPAEAAAQAVAIARDGFVVADGGARVPVAAQTLCIHGDTPGAPLIARAVREALERL